MAELVALPLNGTANTNADIAAHLREQADWVDEGSYDDIRNVFMVFEMADGTIRRQTCGAPCDLARALGVLSIAIIRASIGE